MKEGKCKRHEKTKGRWSNRQERVREIDKEGTEEMMSTRSRTKNMEKKEGEYNERETHCVRSEYRNLWSIYNY